jgi:hypothetical protein
VGGDVTYVEANHGTKLYHDAGARCYLIQYNHEMESISTAELGDDEIDVSDFVTVQGDIVDVATLDTYTITYACAPHTYTTATETKQRVVYVRDTTCATCSQTGSRKLTIEASMGTSQIPGFGVDVNCSDSFYPSSALTKNVEATNVGTGKAIAFDNVHSTIGTFLVTYSVTDPSGNGQNDASITGQACPAITQFTRTVVVEDTLKPVIGLKFDDGSGNNVFHVHALEDKKTNPAMDKDAFPSRVGWSLMAESGAVNGWMVGAIACAAIGVALLATSKAARPSEIAQLV